MKYLLWFLVLSTTVLSCSKGEQEKKSLSKEPFSLGQNISSISQGEGMVWVGTDGRNAFLFDGELYHKYTLSSSGLIYNILPHIGPDGDTTIFVGVRNSGLWQYLLDGRKANLIGRYELPVDSKSDNYSPYDFVLLRDTLYIGTSNGFYKTSVPLSSSTLQLIYPCEATLKVNTEFGCYSLLNLRDGKIGVASAKGVLIYEPHSGNVTRYLQDRTITSIVESRDTLFALSKDYLFTISGGEVDSLPCINSPDVYFEDLAHNKWLIASNSVRIGKEIKELFKEMNLSDDVSIPTKGKNIITTDPEGYFTYMITKNALWKIPKNLNIYHRQMDVKTSSVDERGDMYIICGENRLFVKKKNSLKASFVTDINVHGEILWMDSFAGKLYLHTNHTAYILPIPTNSLFTPSPDAAFAANEIFAANLHRADSTLYIGNREGLFVVRPGNKVDTVQSMKKRYITSIFHNDEALNPDHIYVSTLNDGVFHSTGKAHTWFDNPMTPPIFTQQRDITDVISCGNTQIVLTVDQRIVLPKGCFPSHRPNPKKLIYVNDSTFYTVHDRGLDRYLIKDSSQVCYSQSLFKDIKLSPKACFMVNDSTMILGAEIGVFSINVLDDISGDGDISWLTFEPVSSVSENLSQVVICLLLLVIAISGYLYYHKVERMRIKHSSLNQKKQITELTLDLSSILPLLDNNSNDAKRIHSLTSQSRKAKSLSNTSVEQLYFEVREFYSRIILQMPDIIGHQIESLNQISNPKAKVLAKISIELKEQRSFVELKNQALSNLEWISRYQSLRESIEADHLSLKDCAQVEGVSKGLTHRLEIILNTLTNSAEVELCQEKYRQLSPQIRAISSAEAKQRITRHLQGIKEYFANQSLWGVPYAPISRYIQDIMDYSPDNMQTLRCISHLDYQMDIISKLDNIMQLSEDEPLERHSKVIQSKISDLYKSLDTHDQEAISNVCNIDNPQTQSPQILVLLLANKKIKSAKLPIIIGVYSNLNAVKSRLLSELKNKSEYLKNLQLHQGSSSVILARMIDLIK